MKLHYYINKKRIICVSIVFFLSLLIASSICYLTLILSTNYEKNDAKHLAQIQAGKVQYVLDHKLQTVKTVAMLVIANHGDTKELDPWILDIVDYSDIESVSLAPSGVITNTYPLVGNEATIGHDIIHDPKRATETLSAIDSGVLTLSGPYNLKQGYLGLIGRIAIYVEDDHGNMVFWGLSCVCLKLPDALEDAQLSTLLHKNYQYQIWRINPDTEEKQIINTSSKFKNKDHVTEKINLPNSTWYLSIYPEDGWVPPWTMAIRIIIAILFSVLTTMLYWYISSLGYSRNNLRKSMEQQSENYHQMNILNEELKNFRHDMKNHMLSISNLLNNNDNKQALSYIKNINQTFLSTPSITNTENFVFDALLSEKKKKAKEHNIDMDCEVYLSRKLDIDNVDWTILFGNVIDNAIEACCKEGIHSPRIRMQILCKGNMLHAKVSNTCIEDPILQNGTYMTTKQNAKWHGQGIKQMESIINKYHGTIEITFEHHVFTVSFMLCDI